MTFCDLFAGAGGFSLGFEMAGGECLLMLEKDEWAFNTYKQNRPGSETIMINGDIKDLSLESLARQMKQRPDVIIGGPPCQGFSTAAGARNFNDSRNELFEEFFKWVDYFRPKFFVIENVPGLTFKKDKSGKSYKDLIIEKFEGIEYSISFWTLNAMEYGVPQQRKRVFFIGSRISKEQMSTPEPTHSFERNGLKLPVTVGDAISDLPVLNAGQGAEELKYPTFKLSDYQKWAREGSKMVYNHVAMNHTDRMVSRYKLLQQGGKMEDIPDELKVRKRGDSENLSSVIFDLNYRVLHHDKVSLTIPASFYSSFVHPFQPRNITAREAARLQSFPDWYSFYGKRTLMSNSMLKSKGIEPNLSQYNQIGNAVPPLLAKAIAESIKQALEAEEAKKQLLGYRAKMIASHPLSQVGA